MSGFDFAPILAENIEFPDGIEAADHVHVLQPCAVVGRDQPLLGAAARQIGSRSARRRAAGIDLRQGVADDHGFVGARLLQASVSQCIIEVGIGSDGPDRPES